jgi:hypothetical protein
MRPRKWKNRREAVKYYYQKQKERMKKDPEFAERERRRRREWTREYRSKPGVKKRIKERHRWRMANDPEYREKRQRFAREQYWKNRERHKEYMRRWCRDNADKVKGYAKKRQAKESFLKSRMRAYDKVELAITGKSAEEKKLRNRLFVCDQSERSYIARRLSGCLLELANLRSRRDMLIEAITDAISEGREIPNEKD